MLFNEPPKEPIGVLVAPIMKTSLKVEVVDIDRRVVVCMKHY